MNAVPAKVAGVPRVVMVVPTPDGELNPLVLAAARLAGVDEVYRVGGAQAVAALAYGTETIAPGRQDRRPRQRLCGGGQAPRLRHRRHRHDRRPVRGADHRRQTGNDPDWIAADLLAQAEHDAAAQSILITDDARLADAVERGGRARSSTTLPRGGNRRAQLARLRRDHPGARLRRRRRPRRPDRARASRDRGRRPRAARRAHPQCRRDLSRPPHAGGDRRLCRRLQPRAADGALGALLLRARRCSTSSSARRS